MVSKSRFAAAYTSLLLALLTSAVFAGAGEASVQLTASWIDNSGGVASTQLERRLGTDTTYVVVADVPPGMTQYVDTSVSTSTTYCYRAFAYDAYGVSPYTADSCAAPSSSSTLTVTVSDTGTGTGTVASTPSGILCGTTCSATYPAGSSVTLAATPATGSTFTGWSGGGCSGTGTCTVGGNTSVAVTATFTASSTLTVTVSDTGTGTGTVASTPSGILCGTTCSASYPAGTSVTLTATAATGSTFTGWSGGGCSGTGTCTIGGTTSVAVTATFSLVTSPPPSPFMSLLIVATTGPGAVTSTPTGITCGSDCSEPYPSGTVVTLTAAPNKNNNSIFSGWGGGCSGSASTCTVTLSADTAVSAAFKNANKK